MQLPSVSSSLNCTYNGEQLRISQIGSVEYSGSVLFNATDCTFERGHVYGIVAPNGYGKSSFARLIASKTLNGFPQTLSTCYLDSCGLKSGGDLLPVEFLQLAAQSKCRDLKNQIQALEKELEDETISSENLEGFTVRLGELYAQEEDILASSAVEIDNVLTELGFRFAGLVETPLKSLSSGWRYKCDLASALLLFPEFLALDEPSFLDVDSTNWLVRRIKDAAGKGAIVCLISHKEELLADVTDRILHISPSKELEIYNCGYEVFKKARTETVKHAKKESAKIETQQANWKASMDVLQKELCSREKNLQKRREKIMGDKRWIKGKNIESKQKADRSQAAKAKQLRKDKEKLQDLVKVSRRHVVEALPVVGSFWGKNRTMILLQNVSFGYQANSMVFKDLSLAIYGGDRIALTGQNGQGKSTFLKLLVQKLQPTSGSIVHAAGLQIAYFPQNALELLVSEFGDKSAVQFFQEQSICSDLEARRHLGRFGLKGDITARSVNTLSAGQRTRLFLAKLFASNAPPSLLILDEVENLDKESSSVLIESCANFQGSVISVSHNETYVSQFKPKQIWEVRNGEINVKLTDKLVEELAHVDHAFN